MKLNTGITLDTLNPQFRENVKRWAAAVEAAYPQFEVRVTSARRTAQQQNALFRQNSPQRWVTNCDGVRDLSMHQYGLAVDIVLVRRSTGTLDWKQQTYRTVYAHVQPGQFGLETIPQEMVHLQMAGSQARYSGGRLSPAYCRQLKLVVS
ncbi:M15 family metallopeptidase [Deinococcus cellulosilyticus]|uniref:Uncharacterized protein n=1 Tax=Deinococcus cellulosilyticus (strain DSM 18568 / NBRC 106333 / KACC 11606 / 5516J-15) TaxID=1223518 RepID=A0A511N2Z4_DEIC1|nr:M15 family metallopeptidase [Deinococcus cellulosilyticus]GEM47224.1 hypothetical protein DC3_28590 [Deinococcus cellulosilyticus NBRC 106333 = KACC 11606]